MKITEITRRDIIDEMMRQHIDWFGRLEDIQFLSRLYDLEKLPSYDSRYKDMLGDIRQHRVNNYDWENDWVLNDEKKLKHFSTCIILTWKVTAGN